MLEKKDVSSRDGERKRERGMCNQQEMGKSGWGCRRRTDVVMRCHVTLECFTWRNKLISSFEQFVSMEKKMHE